MGITSAVRVVSFLAMSAARTWRAGGNSTPASAELAENEIHPKVTAKIAVIIASSGVVPPTETTSVIS